MANPETFLVDIYPHEKEATELWHKYRAGYDVWSYGFVQIWYKGSPLVSQELWFDVHGFWWGMVELIDEFLRRGRSEFPIPELPVMVGIKTAKPGIVFNVGDDYVFAEPRPFIEGVLFEAQRYFAWTDQHIGNGAPMNEIADLRARLKEELE